MIPGRSTVKQEGMMSIALGEYVDKCENIA